MRRSSNNRPERGFTLLETLIAFTILAVALTALMQSFGSGLRGIKASEAHVIAMMQARSTLEQVSHTLPLEPGERSGEFDNGSEWRLRILPYDTGEDLSDAAPQAVPFELEVTVSWGDDQSVALKSMRLAAPE